MDNLYVAKLEDIPDLVRWVELERRAGGLSEEQASDWYLRIGAWRLWLELNDEGH